MKTNKIEEKIKKLKKYTDLLSNEFDSNWMKEKIDEVFNGDECNN